MKRRPKKPYRKPYHRNRKRQHKRKVRNGCSGKKRYAEYTDAVDEAGRLVQSGRTRRASVYLCAHGEHWHVSSRVQRTAWAVVELEE